MKTYTIKVTSNKRTEFFEVRCASLKEAKMLAVMRFTFGHKVKGF